MRERIVHWLFDQGGKCLCLGIAVGFLAPCLGPALTPIAWAGYALALTGFGLLVLGAAVFLCQ
jgi:hypothetical protein